MLHEGVQCYMKEKLDSRFKHQLEYTRDAFCRQCCSTYTFKISYNFNGMISINGREINNLRFADDIDLIAGTE